MIMSTLKVTRNETAQVNVAAAQNETANVLPPTATKMKIAVVGLGLIGGSFCKALRQFTAHTRLGLDIDTVVTAKALSYGVINRVISANELNEADLTILCLYPKQTLEFLNKNAEKFKPGSVVIDTCGVKTPVVAPASKLLSKFNVTFIGAHPMAGREFSGFEYSVATLFEGASFISTPSAETPETAVRLVEDLAVTLGFAGTVRTTPEEHDRTIAFTSQLAHVVSNAYVKSPSLDNKSGFSAGSFLDLTRVAKLNEEMWASLIMLNREPMLFELQNIIAHLQEYEQTLITQNEPALRELFRDGRLLKEQSL